MNEVSLQIDGGRTEYRPGEQVVLLAGWRLDQSPTSAELRLFWHTKGKGSEDVEIVETQILDSPKSMEERRLTFQLPNAPYSYGGRLMSIIWAAELVVEPNAQSALAEFTLSADGKEVRPPEP
ncbi:MAG: hypothetical protein ACI9OD_004447 [Limisphaerales bacterium]|jgi:hypothetical protein